MQNKINQTSIYSIIALLKFVSEKEEQLKSTQANISDLTQAIQRLEEQKQHLMTQIASRKVNDETLKELEWELSDIQLALKVNNQGGLARDDKPIEELSKELSCHQHDLFVMIKFLQVIS